MQIYTRRGDDGHTTLLDGQRAWKDDPRVRVAGAVDELCSLLGVLAAELPPRHTELTAQFRQVQSELFAVGALAQLQGHLEHHPAMQKIGADECTRLENWIDALETGLPPLKLFILPGGCHAAAVAHFARSACRRVEQEMVALARTADAGDAVPLMAAVAYLNRLSDFLFVLARFLNFEAQVEDLHVN